MPQIRCPNCGTSITLENRREIDYKIIINALQKGSKTFTDLLKITGLPRKTLSIRLTNLCNSGVISKDRAYHLNGSVDIRKWNTTLIPLESQNLAKPPLFTRKNVLLMVMLLIIGAPIAAQVSAMLFTSPSPPPSPKPNYIGTFTVHLKVYDTSDLFAWQAMIHFNSSELVFIEAAEGDFLSPNAPYGTNFAVASDTGPGELLLFGSLLGMDVPGASGTGTLATITFGFKSETYEYPKIVYDDLFDTWLWDSNLRKTGGTLEIELGES